MNKIVCDVCGTSYPETAEQCPICGTAKTDTNKTTTGGEAGYAYVKGGRFSHANVRKRNAGNKDLPRVVVPAKTAKQKPAPKQKTESAAQTAAKKQTKPPQPKKEKKSSSNIILALIAFILVVAIVLVFGLIVKNFFDKRSNPQQSTTSTPAGELDNTHIACDGIRFALSEKTFTDLEQKFQLSVILSPSNTTDSVWYESSNEQVALVSENGIVTPVGDGQAIIYAHCGEFTAECVIICQVGYTPTVPTEPTTQPTQPTEPDVPLELNREEFTLDGYGDKWDLYDGKLDPAKITWTSSDETVAVVSNGKVVAVGNGNATITAEYNGQTVTCLVHCQNVVVSDYVLRPDYGWGADYTMEIGETMVLYLIDVESGKRIPAEDLTFTLAKEGVISIDENGKITALDIGQVRITVTYGELTFKAIVRVIESF